MSHRGEFRTIEIGLLDCPTFQPLNSDARWLYIALKLELGPLGLDVVYGEAIRTQTGLSEERLQAAREALVAAGRLEVEGRVHRLDSIDGSISLDENSTKHRAMAERLLANPKFRGSTLARALAEEHGLTFAGGPLHSPSDTPSKGHPTQDKTGLDKDEPETTPPSLRVGDEEQLGSDRGWTEPIAEAIRSFWWLGEDPPAKAPQGWSMGAELPRFKRWHEAKVDLGEMLCFIEGGALRRDAGELPGVQIGEGVTGARFRYKSLHDPESDWHKNITAYRAEQEKSCGVSRGGDPTHISEALQGIVR